ncbi:MAG: phosphomannomutase/phosphoglucomutase [Proteobacteria bacterium]|nr:phosphomannomutase/phosphoglucomutase [Pseudomonadota bacterium]
MPIAEEIFKAYDIRGIVDESLTVETVTLIGRALGSIAQEAGVKSMVIGRDGRLSGPKFAEALASGMLSSGIDVIDIGRVPTPVLYFATYELGTGSGVEITGSHNPPEYNGLKMMIDGVTLSGEQIQLVKQRILNRDFKTGEGTLKHLEMLDKYARRIVSDISLARPMKVVIDCGNGVAGAIATDIFRGIGCEVTELFCEVDGTFPNHHPDPSQAENLVDLIKAVQDTNSEFGMAFDGDGDRLGIVTKEGDIIWPDRQMILFARDVLSRNPGAEVIFDVKCTRTLPTAIEAAGGKATMWKTGHSFIKSKLKESGAALAGEMSGHIFFKERWYGFDDGIYAGVRLCELLSRMEQAPSEVFAALPDTVNTPELRLKFEEGEHYKFIEKLQENADFKAGTVHTMDGLRVDFDGGFGLVRASNTTPMLIMRFEADDEAMLKDIQEQFRAVLLKTDPAVKLPF